MDIGAIQALIVVIILLVGTLLSDWVGYKLAKYLDANLVQNRDSNRLELDKSRTIYQNSISYFMYAIALYIVGFMAKSPIWFLAASIFATSAIANAFFEFAMKEGICRLGSNLHSDDNMMWSEFFTYEEWPIVFMLSTILIYYPLSWGLFDVDTIHNIYLILITLSITIIGAVYSAGFSSSSLLKNYSEKAALNSIVSSFYMLCLIHIILSLFGYIHAHNPLELQDAMLLLNTPIPERVPFIWKDITDIVLLGSSVSLFIGMCLYMRSIMSLIMKIRYS